MAGGLDSCGADNAFDLRSGHVRPSLLLQPKAVLFRGLDLESTGIDAGREAEPGAKPEEGSAVDGAVHRSGAKLAQHYVRVPAYPRAQNDQTEDQDD